MDFERRKVLFNQCNPEEALEVGDERNIDLDGHETGLLRGRAWADTLAEEFLLSDRPLYKLLSGLPGSGKSTELRRLRARLEREGFLVVLLDADERLDLTNTIGEPELLAAVVYELERRVLELEGKNPDAAATEGYLSRLWNWLNTTDIEPKAAQVKLDPGANLVVELKTRPSFRERVRGLVRNHLTDFLADVKSSVADLEDRAARKGKDGVVIIVDSLEKLRGMSDNWESVMESAERVFRHGDARLPVHTLYTVPAALLSRLDSIEFMPALKVRDRTGRSFSAALELLSKLMLLRIPSDEDRHDLLGDAANRQAVLERMILNSGGYLRNLISDLRDLVRGYEGRPVTLDDVARQFQRRVDDYRKQVTDRDVDWLVRVRRELYHTLPDSSEESRRTYERLLSHCMVLRYQNDADWFDLHPAVASIPPIRTHLESGAT